MRRRDFIGAAAAFSALVGPARAQRGERKRVGILIGSAPDDPAGLGFADAVMAGLAEEGWIAGSNLDVQSRFNPGDPVLATTFAAELIAGGVDGLVCGATPNAVAAQRLTSTIPIVFVAVLDPVAAGLVQSFARPGGNVTGFTNFEPTVGGRWLSLLKQAWPALEHAVYAYNPDLPTGAAFVPSLLDAGLILDVGIETVGVRTGTEIDAAIAGASLRQGGGFVLGYDNFMFSNRPAVLEAVARHPLPAIYGYQNFADEGGLMAYAVDTVANFHRGGVQLGRIFNGADPAELPVQAPAGFLLVLNLGTAAELGLDIPVSLIAAADRVIE
ncbi:MAG: ABC transporter substrate-binding protein [Bauldia sp.]